MALTGLTNICHYIVQTLFFVWIRALCFSALHIQQECPSTPLSAHRLTAKSSRVAKVSKRPQWHSNPRPFHHQWHSLTTGPQHPTALMTAIHTCLLNHHEWHSLTTGPQHPTALMTAIHTCLLNHHQWHSLTTGPQHPTALMTAIHTCLLNHHEWHSLTTGPQHPTALMTAIHTCLLNHHQ